MKICAIDAKSLPGHFPAIIMYEDLTPKCGAENRVFIECDGVSVSVHSEALLGKILTPVWHGEEISVPPSRWQIKFPHPNPDPQRFEIPDFLTLKLVISTLKVPEMTGFRVKKSGISNR